MAMTWDLKLAEPIRRAETSDWKQLGLITAEAFYNDPVSSWIFGKTQAIDYVFTTLAREIYLKYGFCHMIDDKAAAMWLPYGALSQMRSFETLRLAWQIFLSGSRGCVLRAIEADKHMQANHPKEPHLYLFSIGTRIAARGTGLGKALLAPVLAAADDQKLPVYLENSNPKNHGFYVVHGFETIGTFTSGTDTQTIKAPTLEKMWRLPR
jgi:ribosomal protein S18 acetylase RimI-like enzyme